MPAIPERGAWAGDDGATRKPGSPVQVAVNPLGQWLALPVTPAGVRERGQVGGLAPAARAAPGQTVAVAIVDPGDTGPPGG